VWWVWCSFWVVLASDEWLFQRERGGCFDGLLFAAMRPALVSSTLSWMREEAFLVSACDSVHHFFLYRMR